MSGSKRTAILKEICLVSTLVWVIFYLSIKQYKSAYFYFWWDKISLDRFSLYSDLLILFIAISFVMSLYLSKRIAKLLSLVFGFFLLLNSIFQMDTYFVLYENKYIISSFFCLWLLFINSIYFFWNKKQINVKLTSSKKTKKKPHISVKLL